MKHQKLSRSDYGAIGLLSLLSVLTIAGALAHKWWAIKTLTLLLYGVLGMGPISLGASPVWGPRLRRYGPRAMQVTGALCVAWLGALVYRAFNAPFDLASPTFGTPYAPYSDAMEPWLVGGLHFLFGLPTLYDLYRPTIGLFWGSILAVSERIWVIPAFFAVQLVASWALLTLSTRDRPGYGLALLASMLATCIVGNRLLDGLFAPTLGVDFPAFVLAGCGALFLTAGVVFREKLAVYAGAILLGCAGAIRGPLMLGGPVLIGLMALATDQKKARFLVTTLTAFALPIILDISLQRALGIANNGIEALFCVATDPAGYWTPECHLYYVTIAPSASDVFHRYVQFLLSEDNEFLSRLWERVSNDALSLGMTVTGVGTLIAGGRWLVGVGPRTEFVAGLALLTALIVGSDLRMDIGVLLVPYMLVFSSVRRNWLSAGVLACYAVCTGFTVLLGFAYTDRIAFTYSYLLPFGIALAFASTPGPQAVIASPCVTLRIGAQGTIAVLIALYTAVFWFPSELRSVFEREVKGRKAALKITEDADLDRSLYFTGSGELVYTPGDGHRVGSARTFSGFVSDSMGNESFLRPNRFRDQEP